MSVESATRRIDELAQCKKTPPGFIEDRRSVYWVDKKPPQPPTVFAVSERLEELVKSKSGHRDFVPDRPSPIWKVPTAALHFPERRRLKQLAQPKPFHQQWIPMRSAYTVVSESAKQGAPTKRLIELARPKTYDPLLVKSNSSWDWGEWKSDIPKESLNHVASGRLEQLAEAKPTPKSYEENRGVMWPVSLAAKTAEASTRQQQLAKPKTRTALDQDYDPYKVSFAARNAVASPRIEEIATAIPRKVRAKK
uniref:Testicular haploid expressed gene protein-like n=1 Tax=Ciona intestinalis TaxID=7719 RepID=F6UMN4_CIOIN|nr:testicular haploid expressed gene protein-like [Ciona intestinalis]XP_026696539.1 testicular haploid expressed gene protein-like [Ciona intestinalis]|eukprot:XP_002126454.1 testicular haploid expressed gene protein-like [Ciona intestinalis]